MRHPTYPQKGFHSLQNLECLCDAKLGVSASRSNLFICAITGPTILLAMLERVLNVLSAISFLNPTDFSSALVQVSGLEDDEGTLQVPD